jgi:hypothetical protein
MKKNRLSTYLSTEPAVDEQLYSKLSVLKKQSGLKKNEKKILAELIDLSEKNKGSIQVLKVLASFLQMANNEEVLAQYNLNDIDTLYRKACLYNKFDVELHVEYFYFLFNVMDKEQEAIELFIEYKKFLNNYLSKFEEYVNVKVK